MNGNHTNWKLCCVTDKWAWFTTHSLDELSGDDWNDSPYQCNGSLPYEPTRAFKDESAYLKVAFDGCLNEASQVHGSNNNISMNDLVHRKSVPWLQTNKHDLKYDEDLEHVNIFSGVSVGEFEEMVTRAGGEVYYPNTLD